MKRLLTGVNRLTQVLNAINNGITVQDPTGKVVFANDAAARILGVASGDKVVEAGGRAILGKFDFYDKDDNQLSPEALPGRRALKGIAEPEMVIGYRPIGEDSELKWATIKAQPIQNRYGKVVLAVNVFQDVTLQLSTERQLKEANARVTKLLEQTLHTTGSRASRKRSQKA